MTPNIMFILQNMYLIALPITTILTTFAMLLPYWWSSETFQVGLWRARSLSSSWISIEPETDTQEGRLLFILQILSFLSILLTHLSSFIWLITLLRRTYHTSLISHLSLLFLTILIYFILSIMTFFVWYATKNHLDVIQPSYSFYLTLIILLFHTITLISITINIAKYRTNHHTIQPYQLNEKISLAFSEPIV